MCCVADFGESLFEEFVVNFSGLWQTIHSFVNADVDVSFVVNEWAEIVSVDDDLWDEVNVDAHEFWSVEICIEIEIFDVNAEEFGRVIG